MKKTKECQQAIAELSRESPDYVEEARIRADTKGTAWQIDCPKCHAPMKVLHLFPQLEFHPDPMIGTDWHVRCDPCGLEDLITLTGDMPTKQTRKRKL